jgi:hypothetical protein
MSVHHTNTTFFSAMRASGFGFLFALSGFTHFLLGRL